MLSMAASERTAEGNAAEARHTLASGCNKTIISECVMLGKRIHMYSRHPHALPRVLIHLIHSCPCGCNCDGRWDLRDSNDSVHNRRCHIRRSDEDLDGDRQA